MKIHRIVYAYKLEIDTNKQIKDVMEGVSNLSLEERLFKQFISKDDSPLLLLEIDSVSENQIKGTYNKLRYDFPQLIDITSGNIKNIVREDNDLILDRSHFVYYPQTKILCGEYNHSGARGFMRFQDYLTEVIPQIGGANVNQIVFDPVIAQDTLERLGSVDEIVNIDFKLRAPNIKYLDEIFKFGYGAALDEITDSFKGSISLKISYENNKPNFNVGKVIEKLISLVKKSEHSTSERIKLKSKDSEGKTDCFDLLKDKIARDIFVNTIDDVSRVVDSNQMYAALIEFYNSNQDYFSD